MSKLRVACFAISVDGFAAGPEQSLHNPMGVAGTSLHGWAFKTDTLQRVLFGGSGLKNADDGFVARGFDNVGAWIMGRNMFGPVRGEWPDDSWQGWWGDNPPYHVPVFVLTQHARAPITMAGGTQFHFITGGIHEALAQAREAAQGRDVRIGGGAHTVRQYLAAGLVDEVHLVLSPVLLGAGETLFNGINMAALGFRCVEHVATEDATHVVLRKG